MRQIPTLARLLAETLRETSGSIELDGVDITALTAGERNRRLRDVQMVFQSPYTSLDPRMRVGQTGARAAGCPRAGPAGGGTQCPCRCHAEAGGPGPRHLFPARFPHELSGGQRQRVGIARVLVGRTRVVICEQEPVSALDVSVPKAQVINLLRELQAELQMAYVFVSHDLAVVGAISHEIAVMYLGRVVEFGAARDVLRAPRHPYTQVLVESTNIPEPRCHGEGARPTSAVRGRDAEPVGLR